MVDHVYIFLTIAFIASIISGVVGFGAGLILISFGALFFDIKETIYLANIYFIGLTLSRCALYYKNIDYKVAGLTLALGVPMILLGATLFVETQSRLISTIFGICVLLYIVSLKFTFWRNFVIRPSHIVIGGGAWGFLSGFIGDGNLAKAIVFDQIRMPKETFVGTIAVTSLTANIIKLVIYQKLEISTEINFVLIAILLLVACVGTLISGQILRRMPVAYFRPLMLLMLASIAIKLLCVG